MNVKLSTIVLSLFFVKSTANEVELDVDPNGYVAYCPCMGKFLKTYFIDLTKNTDKFWAN